MCSSFSFKLLAIYLAEFPSNEWFRESRDENEIYRVCYWSFVWVAIFFGSTVIAAVFVIIFSGVEVP